MTMSTGYSAAVHRGEARHRRGLRWLTPGWLCVLAALLLSLLGLAAIGTTHPEMVAKQMVLLGLGILAAMVVAVPHMRWLQLLSLPFMILVLLMLLFLLIPGVPDQIVHPRNGARRWINIGFTDMHPS